MAIATLKFDENGNPKQAKYRIVALGNLDPYSWTKDDCFAPVMSQLELRLLVSKCVSDRRNLKNMDVKQAFCQSNLPDNENYIMRPPPGCPLTPKNTYMLLRKTLYGLKRSPRHWYDKAKSILEDIGLTQCPHSPCLFFGKIIPGKPPIYIGLYVNDIAYCSLSDEAERYFESEMVKRVTAVDIMGTITHFLGIKFTWINHPEGHVTCKLSQEAFVDNLVQLAELESLALSSPTTPYRSGLPVDSIGHPPPSDPVEQQILETKYRSIVGSLNWLAHSTRPDISTITSLLAQHQSKVSKSHLTSARFVVKYLKGTRNRGISFSSRESSKISSFVKFEVKPNSITAMTDANWGPQDQSELTPKYNKKLTELENFVTRSMSGFLVWYNGSLHWCAKRQKCTSRSSAESEIYATDECVKVLLELKNIITDLGWSKTLLPRAIPVFNDNTACVSWSKSTTSKRIRHMQIRENAIRDSVLAQFVTISHCDGKTNLADIFTKEDRDSLHFISIRNLITCDTSIP